MPALPPSPPQDERRPWLARPSPLARRGLALYTLALVLASLHPLSGWRASGAGAFDFINAPWPRWWTWFDFFANVAFYMPFGWLGVLALWPRVRGAAAPLIVSLAGLLLSLCLEATQNWLPTRIPSNLDWATNTVGAVLGAAIGQRHAPALVAHGRLMRWWLSWFRPDAAGGLLLLALWLYALVRPQPLPMGMGEVVEPLRALLREPDWMHLLDAPLAGLEDLLDGPGGTLASGESILVEATVLACALGAAGAVLCETLRAHAPRAQLLALLVALGFAVKAGATVVLPLPYGAFDWLSAGVQAGLLVGALGLYVLAALSPAARRRAGLLLLAVGTLLVNVAPQNAYQLQTIAPWQTGRWADFSGLARWTSIAWPWLAAGFLWARGRRDRRRRPSGPRPEALPPKLESRP